MPLRFYNTLSQQVADFTPQRDNTVRMYTCGPTVYDYAHIGNFRTFTFVDILRRWLRASGFQLDHVMNITDVDDKIIRNAVAHKKSLEEYTAHYKQAFRDDCALLRLETPERLVPATEHIHEMADAIARLSAGGHTYESDGSIYFRISTFPEYGKLSHNDFSGIRAGARVDMDEYEKADARDFALWKAPKEGEVFWDEKIGRGRPGWHIECSVMALEYLGETLDIHAGGIDLIFPHHENEIAQSESLTGKPFSRFWLHAEFLMVEGQKMSKSLGNYFTLRDILGRGYAPEAVRYLLASVPYRKTLNFTFDGLQSAKTAIERLRNFKLRLETGAFADGLNDALADRTAAARDEFTAAMDDDLNTAEALAAIFEYVREVNSAMDAGEFRSGNAGPALAFLSRCDSVFDVLTPTSESGQIGDAEVESLIRARDEAKKARNFALADQIRQQLQEQGIILEDTKSGTRWKRKSS
ncbi:MAG: cysteine--tRNA ligase [Bryobacteraceae bacterium]|jgi:cysteinyl-tRNA synthetase